MGVQPAKPEEQEILRATLKIVGPGHHSADRIYRCQLNAARSLGRAPMNRIRLGQVLAEYGATRRPKWDKTKERPNKPRGFPEGYMVKGWVL